MKRKLHSCRPAFTLLECLFAVSVVTLMTLVLMESTTVALRIARENAEVLAAEAVAWDAAWKKFNEPYAALTGQSGGQWTALAPEAAPDLARYDTPPSLRLSANPLMDANNQPLNGIRYIVTDVEWGPAGKRRRLSQIGVRAEAPYGLSPCLYRSSVDRTKGY